MSKSRKNVFSMETLFRITYDLKRNGKRIGITHGAFDLFHYSHLDLLRQSAALCDYFIVGLDSDKSIQSYKSYRRPIIDEQYRLDIISELDCVDAVFIKEIPTTSDAHIDLYRELKADFITIGYNYSVEGRIEYDALKSGVQLIKLQTKQIYTTTSIIQSIVDTYTTEGKPVVKEK